jgi:hypothetical protein
MKHLKTYSLYEIPSDYKLFEASSSISILPESEQETGEDIRDICIELEDEGYEIFFGSGNGYHSLFIVYKSDKHGYGVFYYKEVEEVIERLKDYLGDRLFKIWMTDKYGAYVPLENSWKPQWMTNTVKIGWK